MWVGIGKWQEESCRASRKGFHLDETGLARVRCPGAGSVCQDWLLALPFTSCMTRARFWASLSPCFNIYIIWKEQWYQHYECGFLCEDSVGCNMISPHGVLVMTMMTVEVEVAWGWGRGDGGRFTETCRVRHAPHKAGECGRVKKFQLGPSVVREQALQGAVVLTDVEEPLSHGKLGILSKEITGLDDRFWREHIGGCVQDGLEAGREEAGQRGEEPMESQWETVETWVQVLAVGIHRKGEMRDMWSW